MSAAPSLKPDEMKCMPYTEETARFFYDILLAMCYSGAEFSWLLNECHIFAGFIIKARGDDVS